MCILSELTSCIRVTWLLILIKSMSSCLTEMFVAKESEPLFDIFASGLRWSLCFSRRIFILFAPMRSLLSWFMSILAVTSAFCAFPRALLSFLFPYKACKSLTILALLLGDFLLLDLKTFVLHLYAMFSERYATIQWAVCVHYYFIKQQVQVQYWEYTSL